MSDRVEIVEVGPRDGLQNEAAPVSVADRISLINALSQVGFARIEATSFVSPRWVPQMAGAGEVMAGITRATGVRYTALTPNMRGLEDAIVARVDEVAVFASASEAFSKANINTSIADSLARYADVAERAVEVGLPVRGYISCVTDCPYDGEVPPESVAQVAAALVGMGCFEVSLGDTLGRGRPERIDAMLRAVRGVADPTMLAGHFHDTDRRAIGNVDVALTHGLRVFDASVAGLGGCPYAPGAAGNLATGRLAAHLAAKGFDHGLDLKKLEAAEALAMRLRKAPV